MGEPGFDFIGGARGMIVEDQLDRWVGWIGGVVRARLLVSGGSRDEFFCTIVQRYKHSPTFWLPVTRKGTWHNAQHYD
jgi:hypothetical protein